MITTQAVVSDPRVKLSMTVSKRHQSAGTNRQTEALTADWPRRHRVTQRLTALA